MAMQAEHAFGARKTPVQERSGVTVEAIYEATIQVLLQLGLDRLTTTRVASRAGVSVGTLYQYYPNKQALVYALLERHLLRVTDALEQVCAAQHDQPLEVMAQAMVSVFIDAKMERPEISVALYKVSSELDGAILSRRMTDRGRKAMCAMLRTMPCAKFEQVESTASVLFSAMAGTTRAVLEAGATPKMVRMLRHELTLLCKGYLAASSTLHTGETPRL